MVNLKHFSSYRCGLKEQELGGWWIKGADEYMRAQK